MLDAEWGARMSRRFSLAPDATGFGFADTIIRPGAVDFSASV